MKEYKEVENNLMVANESQAVYRGSPRGERFVSGELMDELMRQSDEAKLYIISRLSESMMKDPVEAPDPMKQEKRKEIEAKLDELHVTGGLRRLFGAAPFIDEDDDWKKEKEAYLRNKYGM